jgi:hypothetical protein
MNDKRNSSTSIPAVQPRWFNATKETAAAASEVVINLLVVQPHCIFAMRLQDKKVDYHSLADNRR